MSRRLPAIALLFLCLASSALAASLPETYREAKAALEAGDPAKAVALLEPALAAKEGEESQRTLAGLALGLGYLRTGKAESAIPLFEKAAALWTGKAEAAEALAPLGDALRATGKTAEARAAYAKAAAAAPATPLGKYAQARTIELTGEEQAAQKDYLKAAESFLSAGDALLALGAEDPAYLADARALFVKVAQAREWRGEPTARAVFSMGEVERAQGHLPEALAYYQRTFASWTRYPHWCAQAYLRAADCMEKLGKHDFALQHLREMVNRPEKYGQLPEYQQAKKQLRAWGEKVQ